MEELIMPTTKETLQNGLTAGINAIITGGTTDAGKLKTAVEQLATSQAKLIDDQLQTQLDVERNKVLLAEMQSNDSFTRRARPTVVYAGLVFIFLLHVALPFFAFIAGSAPPTHVLPEEFWWSWTGVVSVWVLGRSYEKVNVPGAINKAIVGGQ
jgi:hypothetical protein